MGKNYGWQSTIQDINQSKQSIEIQQPLWSVDLDLYLMTDKLLICTDTRYTKWLVEKYKYWKEEWHSPVLFLTYSICYSICTLKLYYSAIERTDTI